MSRKTHPEAKRERRQRARLRAKVAKVEQPRLYRGRDSLSPSRPRVVLTSAQVDELRKRGLRHPDSASAWLIREVAARPPERYRRRSASP
jgi:hypothetical protein